MAADSDRCSGRSPSELHESFAAHLQTDRGAILASFAKRLEDLQSPVSTDPVSREQAMAIATEIIADIVLRVRGDDTGDGDHGEALAWLIGAVRVRNQLGPADLLRTAVALFDVVVSSLARYVADDPELLPCLVTAVLALNESISRRVSETTAGHTGYLLERIDQAQVEERLRIARDLHDRIGEGLSIALRQLDLREIHNGREPAKAERFTAVAKEAIIDTMGRLRVMTTDLRQDSVRNLETALVRYIDSAAADAEVRLQVSGDEKWAPPGVIDEAYQIIREAVRNAFSHGSPKLVRIGITIAPHELSAWVEDDGCGFEAAAKSAGSAPAGTGIATMNERAASVGGRLTLASVPDQGTYLGLVVPLPGRRDERSG